MKRFLILLLILSMVFTSVIACSDPADDGEDTNGPADSGTAESGSADLPDGMGADGKYYTDLTSAELQQWSDTEFTVRTVDLGEARIQIDFEEITDDPVDLSVYYRTAYIEQQMGIDLVDIIDNDYYSGAFTSLDSLVTAGDDSYYLFNVRCIESITAWSNGNIYTYDEIEYVNLDKGYWAQDLNPGLTLLDQQYIAVGAADLNVYDFMFTLLFSKKLFEDRGLPNIYELVDSGEWTIDKMSEIMKNSYFDENSSDTRDSSDYYGYLADQRMVLPHFLVASEVLSVYKDDNDYPVLNFENEKFYDVLTRVFEVMWDEENWYENYSGGGDVPADCITMFSQNQALFLDCSFNYVPSLRSMETDFGIIPYPKWDTDQDQYHSRVSYFFSLVIPITCKDTGLTGAVLELMNCYSANEVIPAYYDQSLQGKIARDEESQRMLDIIFNNRIADLGDTTFCDIIRDGVLSGMFGANNRNMSTLTQNTKKINKQITKYLEEVGS